MISKELLSKILNVYVSMEPILEEPNFIGYLVPNAQKTVQQVYSQHHKINIYELAHMCKEWAYNKGIAIDSCFQTAVIHLDKPIEIKASTEPEAIIKACEWILNARK